MITARRFPRLRALATVVAFAALVRAEDSRPEEPKYGLPTPSSLTAEQQERILQTFKAAEPHLRTFALNFQSARFSLVRSDPKSSNVTTATTVDVGRFSVTLVFSGTFDADFTRLLKSRCELFGAFDNERKLKPREQRTPLRLRLEDMAEFCQSPDDFLQKRFAAAPQP